MTPPDAGGAGTPPAAPSPAARPRWRNWLRVAVHWRDWRVPWKLAAVVAVPAVFAVMLSAQHTVGYFGLIDNYKQADRQVAVSMEVRDLLTALQHERDGAAGYLANGRVGDQADLRQQAGNTDHERHDTDEIIQDTPGLPDPAVALVGRLRDTLHHLPELRQGVATGHIAPGQAVIWYGDTISTVLDFERAVLGGFDNEIMSRKAAALYDLSAAEEQIYFQHSLVLVGIGAGKLYPGEQQLVRDSQVRLVSAMNDFHLVADPSDQADYNRNVVGPMTDERTKLEEAAVTAPTTGHGQFPVAQHDWTATTDSVTFALRAESDRLTAELRDFSTKMEDYISGDMWSDAVVLIVVLLLVGTAAFIVARQLVRSLGVLRQTALDIAAEQLPDKVRRLRDGTETDLDVAPVPVHSKEEVGEVARAFDEVHQQAVRLAAEQHELRLRYNNVFVNLSRRGQSLVERQLSLFEQLERDEEDAAHLATLFQLDHLATRMRRNNDNLMVLSGGELARRFSQPVPLTDLLRAAVSEIEHYPRVLLRTNTSARVMGHAASDVLRLLAELMDNAANFSPPQNKVTVATYPNPQGSITVDILDRGIGMTEQEADAANERLITAPELDIAAARRMGLFVVGRLARRHGITVRLFASQSLEGVRAAITLPAGLIVTDQHAQSAPELPPAARMVGAADVDAAETPAAQGNDADATAEPVTGQSQDTARPGPVPHPADAESRAADPAPHTADTATNSDGDPSATNGSHAAADHTRDGHHGTARNGNGNGSRNGNGSGSGHRANGRNGNGRNRNGAVTNPAAATARIVADLFNLPVPRELSDDVTPEPVAAQGQEPDSGGAAAEPRSAQPIVDLFSAGGDPDPEYLAPADWSPDEPLPADQQTTPIFDTLASAWFRAGVAQPEPTADAERPEESEQPARSGQTGWTSAADTGWRVADEVAQDERPPLTTAGLPKRVRGARLVPGSVAAAEAAAAVGRDPEALRGRLNRFQRAVHTARHSTEAVAARAESADATTESADAAVESTAPATDSTRTEQDWSTPSSPAESAVHPEPVAGHSERKPDTSPAAPADDPDDTHWTKAETTGTRQDTESAAESTGVLPVADTGEAESTQTIPAVGDVAEPDRMAKPMGAFAWGTPGSDAGGESADRTPEPETAEETPVAVTTAGLPRRVPRARLQPGSVPETDGPDGAPERNAEAMRGRLSSFQRGVQRGRRDWGSTAASTVLERRQEDA